MKLSRITRCFNAPNATALLVLLLLTTSFPGYSNAQDLGPDGPSMGSGYSSPSYGFNKKKKAKYKVKPHATRVVNRTLVAPDLTLQILAGPSVKPGQASSLLDDFGFMRWQIPSFELPISLDGETATFNPSLRLRRFGLAFGFLDQFEVGVTSRTRSKPVDPDLIDEDAEPDHGPFTAWVTAQIHDSDTASFGARLSLTRKLVQEDDDAANVSVAFPYALHMGGSAMLDGAARMQVQLDEELVPIIGLPLRMTVQPIDAFFFGARTEFNFVPTQETAFQGLPLGFFVGYTYEHNHRPLFDLTGSINWPLFATATNDYEEVVMNTFILGVGVTAHLSARTFGLETSASGE